MKYKERGQDALAPCISVLPQPISLSGQNFAKSDGADGDVRLQPTWATMVCRPGQ